MTREKYIEQGLKSLVSTIKGRDKSLPKQSSGDIKQSLLKQVLGNRGNPDMQSEYSGQFNLSSSLYFQIMEDALRGTLENGESALKKSQLEALDAARDWENLGTGNESKMMHIYRGLDEIPGKSFTQSQFQFRQNHIAKQKK